MDTNSMWEWRGSNIKLMARSIPYYILGAAGHAPAPRIAKLDITYRCNLKCQMCFYWNQNTCARTENIIKASGQELSFADIEQCLIPQLNNVDLEYFSISGGEPLIRSDIYDILSLCGKQEFRTSLNSNLYLIVRKKGAFESVVSAIKHIQIYKRRIDTEHPKLTICCVISRHNQDHLVQTLNLVKELEVETLFFHFIEWQDKLLLKECDRKSRAEMTERELLQIDTESLMSQIEEIVSIAKSITIPVLQEI